jgi:hypothetical protein
VAYPDALDLVRDYLAGLHSGVTVATRVPSPQPATWIQLRQVGGSELPPVRDTSRLDVFYWSTDEPTAKAGGMTVRGEIHALAHTSTLGVVCYRVEEFLQRQTDDPLEGKPGWWATYALTLRANDVVPR